MPFQPVFGKSVLLTASCCCLLAGCALTAPMPVTGNLPASPGALGSQWEDPCSPDWPSTCMPDGSHGLKAHLGGCLARWTHPDGTPDAPPYPRFHPLPTRPMFSPAPDAAATAGATPLAAERFGVIK